MLFMQQNFMATSQWSLEIPWQNKKHTLNNNILNTKDGGESTLHFKLKNVIVSVDRHTACRRQPLTTAVITAASN